MHGLCLLDDKICAAFVVHRFAKARLELFGDVEVVKDGHCAVVFLHNVLLLRRNQVYIVLHLVVDVVIVHVDAVIRWVEHVAQQGNGSASLFKAQLWCLGGLLCFGNGVFPSLHEHLHLCVELCHALAFG